MIWIVRIALQRPYTFVVLAAASSISRATLAFGKCGAFLGNVTNVHRRRDIAPRIADVGGHRGDLIVVHNPCKSRHCSAHTIKLQFRKPDADTPQTS